MPEVTTLVGSDSDPGKLKDCFLFLQEVSDLAVKIDGVSKKLPKRLKKKMKN